MLAFRRIADGWRMGFKSNNDLAVLLHFRSMKLAVEVRLREAQKFSHPSIFSSKDTHINGFSGTAVGVV